MQAIGAEALEAAKRSGIQTKPFEIKEAAAGDYSAV
jgi:hypothetical protein